MSVSARDLIGRVKRPVRSVKLCIDGDLWDEHDQLIDELDGIQKRAGFGAKMGDSSEAHGVAEKLADVEKRMDESAVTFRFQGISTYRLTEIQARFPAKDTRQAWDVQAGAHALIAATLVDPVFTEDEARELLDASTQGFADKLVGVAWLATTGSSDVPFSARASELLRKSD